MLEVLSLVSKDFLAKICDASNENDSFVINKDLIEEIIESEVIDS